MFPVPSNVVLSPDLQTGLEVAGEVLMTFEEPQPGPLGAGILHLVNPPIFRADYCQRMLERKRFSLFNKILHLDLTHIEEAEIFIAGSQTFLLDPRAQGSEVLLQNTPWSYGFRGSFN